MDLGEIDVEPIVFKGILVVDGINISRSTLAEF